MLGLGAAPAVGASGGVRQRDRGLQQPEPEQGAAGAGHGRSGDLVAPGGAAGGPRGGGVTGAVCVRKQLL